MSTSLITKLPTRIKAISLPRSARTRSVTKNAVRMSAITAGYRLLALVASWLLLVLITFGLVPMLGMWLHQSSGAASGTLTTQGSVVMWLAPYLFLLALGVAGTYHVLRSIWRLSSRGIERARTRLQATDSTIEPTAPKVTPARPKKKTPVAATRSGKRSTSNARSK